jgi:hypothetical protein
MRRRGFTNVTVSREVVVRSAETAIREARARYTVPTVLVRRLMRVARTADEFVLGTWVRGDCGCLVGNLLGHVPGTRDPFRAALVSIGMRFDRELVDGLAPRARRRVGTGLWPGLATVRP